MTTQAAPLAVGLLGAGGISGAQHKACGFCTKLGERETAAGVAEGEHGARRPRCGEAAGQTAIIFDWDDTLTCTSWLQALLRENRKPSGDEEQLLCRLAQTSKLVLEKALRSSSHVFIITNAASGWVEESAAEWAPELLSVLSHVHIISARDRYMQRFPHDAAQWKIRTFLEVQRVMMATSTPVSSLVVLGDAHFEMEAARQVAASFQNAVVVKTVKFKPRPSLVELLKELELLAEKFEPILRSPKALNIVLARKGGGLPARCSQELLVQERFIAKAPLVL